MPDIGGTIINLAVNAIAIQENEYAGGLHVFDDVAARTSWTTNKGGATVGTLARVRTLPYLFLYDGTDWQQVPGITFPNLSQAFIDELNDQTDGAVRYVDPVAGDDENDGLTQGTAWQSGERAFDEVPNDPRIGTVGIGAFYSVVVLDNGVRLPAEVSLDRLGGTLRVYVVPDLNTIVPVTTLGAPGAGVKPLAPFTGNTAKVLGSQFEHSGLPAMPALADGTHFVSRTLTFGGSWVFHFPATLDGSLSNGPGGALRVISSFDLIGTTTDARLYAFSQVPTIGPNTGTSDLVLRNRSPDTVKLNLMGVVIPSTIGTLRVDGWSLDGSSVENQFTFFLEGRALEGSSGPHIDPGSGALAIVRNTEPQVARIRGLWRRAFQVEAGRSSMNNGVMVRATDLGEGQVHIGAFGGGPSPPVSCDVDNLDIDGQGFAQNGLHANHNSNVRCGDSAQGIVLIDCNKPVVVRNGARVALNGRIFGRFNTPAQFESGAAVTGVSSIPAQGVDGLANNSMPGNDFTVGGVGNPVLPWAAAPIVDLDTLTRVG